PGSGGDEPPQGWRGRSAPRWSPPTWTSHSSHSSHSWGSSGARGAGVAPAEALPQPPLILTTYYEAAPDGCSSVGAMPGSPATRPAGRSHRHSRPAGTMAGGPVGPDGGSGWRKAHLSIRGRRPTSCYRRSGGGSLASARP